MPSSAARYYMHGLITSDAKQSWAHLVTQCKLHYATHNGPAAPAGMCGTVPSRAFKQYLSSYKSKGHALLGQDILRLNPHHPVWGFIRSWIQEMSTILAARVVLHAFLHLLNARLCCARSGGAKAGISYG